MKAFIKKYVKLIIGLILAVVLSIILFCSFCDRPTHADSGHSTSHSSSHSSHRSSSSSHRSSSFSSSSGSSSNSTSAGGVAGSIIFMVFFLVFISIILSATKNGKNNSFVKINYDDSDIENKIKQYIQNFNKAEFIEDTFKIYKDVQVAWMNFALDDVKDVITDELYNMYESQLAVMEAKGEQNIMEQMTKLGANLSAVDVQNDTITITARYIVTQLDYIADINTKKCIRGESRRKMRVVYMMKFRKTLNDSNVVTKCPNCGAELDINTNGVCSYCRSKVFTENSKWVLTEKQVTSQSYL